jgi:CPA1 family monovalent cation:H+ antiporter
MTTFELAAVFLGLIGVAGWLNARFLRLPTAAVMVVGGLGGAGLLLIAKAVFPAPNVAANLASNIEGLNFPSAVLRYMLAFLLFAGAMQVDVRQLRRRLLAVATLATLGVAASTVIVGSGVWLAARALGLALSAPWAFVFGVLISPTDPIAVLAAVRGGHLSKGLEAVLQGEALFNDGVGIVAFFALVAVAGGGAALNPLRSIMEVGAEAIGGLALGGVAAALVIRAMRAIDDYAVEVSLSLALAVGVYALATALHVSGPISVVIAGLIVGDQSEGGAMSDVTRTHLRSFWMLIDENLNALLFLMLGLQVLVIRLDPTLFGFWTFALVLVLITRLIVVLPWGAFFRVRHSERGASVLLAWGGLHGALSLAMALSLPNGDSRPLVLSTTFAVVIFSIVAQGLTFAPLAAVLATKAARRSR